MQATLWAGIIIVTLAGVALGRLPGLRMNRATICLTGATGLILTGAITLEEAYRAIDLNTITLLFGMMVINANLRLAGFFRLAAVATTSLAGSPRQLLGLVMVASGVLSALFLNDTIVLIFTPLVLELTAASRLKPVPYLIALAIAANLGSSATIIGNPQNMLIGIASGVSFLEFTRHLAPVALMGLGVAWLVAAVVFRTELGAAPLSVIPIRVRTFRPLLIKSLVATGLLLIALVAGMAVPLAALGGAALLLTTRRIRPERVFQEIDWGLLVFFAALFVVTRAIATAGFTPWLFALLGGVGEPGVVGVTITGAVLSNLVSNVPAVLLLQPVVEGSAHPEAGWLTLAMASTLAGNLTLLGSVANLIVAETARRHGVTVGFGAYLVAGVPTTVVSLALGVWWLSDLW